MPTKPKSISLTPTTRDLLAEWPAGQSRGCTEWGSLDLGGRVLLKSRSLTRLEDAGYLELSRTRNRHGYEHIASATRTDKPCRPYRAKAAKAGALWPWSPERHWRLVRQSPSHATRAITKRLTEERVDFTLDVLYPRFVDSKSELLEYRRMLEFGFGVPPAPRSQRGRVRPLYFGVSRRWVFAVPAMVRLLLLELLVEPELDDAGNLVRFRAVDPQQAFEERMRLAGHTQSVKQKYLMHIGRQQ